MGGFEVLGDIKRENREAEEEATRNPPRSCPIDGTPLVERDALLNCPMGNYRRTLDGRVLFALWG